MNNSGGNKKREESVEKSQRDDFWGLVSQFRDSTQASIESYQEAGPREIQIVSVYSDSRSGLACTTDEQGIPHVVVTGTEPGAKGERVRQRYFFGVQTEAITKGRAEKSLGLKGKRALKPFDIGPQADQLIKNTIPPAQDEGDRIQRRIDEENYEWFRVFITPPEENTVAKDVEPDPDLGMVKDLVTFARGEVAERLGAKADAISVELIKVTEHMLYADSLGTMADILYPRVSFVINVKTKEGNTALGVLRGAGGTIVEILSRHEKDPSLEKRDVKAVIGQLVGRVVAEAIDLDRAQTTSIIGGSECPVILGSEAAAVLGHEVFGHAAEADIICANRRQKAVGVTLKARIGAQVSDYPGFSLVDTPEENIDLGGARSIHYTWGALPVDGYGSRGKPVKIVEKGTMVGVLTDRHTLNEIVDGLKDPASILETGVTGNVRRQQYDRPPLIRMRNTFILPDDSGPPSKEEMVKLIPATKKGVFVVSCHGGSVNPDSGDFQIQANLCFLIENRTITQKPIRDVTISGNIKDIGLIEAIGNSGTVGLPFCGWCGKDGQNVPVEAISPLVYIQRARILGGPYRPWLDLVKDYLNQHQEVMEGKRGAEAINLPEFRQLVGEEPQHRICLLTVTLPPGEELRYLMGTDNFSTHGLDESGKPVERRDRYAYS